MKKLILCALFAVCSLATKAQEMLSLNENFNTSCASASGFPESWANYTPVIGTNPRGAWQCAPGNGRFSSNGISCTGTWSGGYNLDTSYLITPALNLSGYVGNVYIQFDTKTTNIYLGGRLSLVISTDSTFYASSPVSIDSTVTPVFTEGDSSGWVTHQANLTPYASSAPLYVAFLYTSTTTTGSIWYLDNVQTTQFPLSIATTDNNTLPLTVIGTSTTSQITLSYKAELAGNYHIAIYDMIGHKIHEENISAQIGNATYILDALQLHSGMYLVKMDNGAVYGTVKTIVQ